MRGSAGSQVFLMSCLVVLLTIVLTVMMSAVSAEVALAHSIKTTSNDNENTGGHLSFSLSTAAPDCVKINYISTSGGFPNLDKGVVTQVRFFYTNTNANDVTVDSAFVESQVGEDENGQPNVSTDMFCGFASGTYYFKYGLFDTNNALIEFMSPDAYSEYSNSVEIGGH